ncbi:hypothetical protein KUF54_06105 [Comamonas sp. Y33R10-2]|uniref:hypothetical protein n=1 Tax=Comamonas sp. Y33R10-2 TaxID=2853257 RepID=UPI001C5CB08C|nr:hypothetical protein [Comamonas sp. Y33R10-2]QXZ10776.1 hypothetical protein KUF54_06105 [Comamonas sp. Y33R10-2]
MSKNYDLCEPLRAIADVIGRERALLLAGKIIRWEAAKGKSIGRRGWVYVPKTHTENSVLAGLVDPDDLAALVAALGGELMQITAPMAPIRRLRDARIEELCNDGEPAALIAWKMNMSTRQVRNVLHAALPADAH